MHEAQLHQHNSFVTLTYEDKHLPDDYSVDVRTHQLFMKRLRERVGTKIRFFASGEYGETTLRPHYHYLLFGYRPPDLKYYSTNNGNKLYTSTLISEIWPYGQNFIGNVTYQSAGYVARYVVKKIGGDLAAAHYSRVHPVTGKCVQVKPEFGKQSNRPGIGHSWLETFKSDIYPCDFVVVDGKQHGIPKYYTRKLAEEEQTQLKRKRKVHARKNRADNTPARLKVRETVKTAQLSMLKRTLR